MIHVWLPPGCQGFLSRPPLLRTGADLVEIACLREELLYRSGVLLKTPTPALKQAPDQVSPNMSMRRRDSIRERLGEWFVEASERVEMQQTLFMKRAVHSPNGLVRTMSWLANREKSTSLNFFAWSYRELKKGFD